MILMIIWLGAYFTIFQVDMKEITSKYDELEEISHGEFDLIYLKSQDKTIQIES